MPELVAKSARRSASDSKWGAKILAAHSVLLVTSASETVVFSLLTIDRPTAEAFYLSIRLCTKSHLLGSEHRRFAFADRQCLTAMCNQPKQLLRILHIFVAYLTIGDWRFQI